MIFVWHFIVRCIVIFFMLVSLFYTALIPARILDSTPSSVVQSFVVQPHAPSHSDGPNVSFHVPINASASTALRPLSVLYVMGDSNHDSAHSVALLEALIDQYVHGSSLSDGSLRLAPRALPTALLHLGDLMYPNLQVSEFSSSALFSSLMRVRQSGIDVYGTVGNHDMVAGSCASWRQLFGQPCFGTERLNAQYVLARFNTNAPLSLGALVSNESVQQADASLAFQWKEHAQILSTLPSGTCRIYAAHHPAWMLDGRTSAAPSRYLAVQPSVSTFIAGHGHYAAAIPSSYVRSMVAPSASLSRALSSTSSTSTTTSGSWSMPSVLPLTPLHFTLGSSGAAFTVGSGTQMSRLEQQYHWTMASNMKHEPTGSSALSSPRVWWTQEQRHVLLRLILYPGAYRWELLALDHQRQLVALRWGISAC